MTRKRKLSEAVDDPDSWEGAEMGHEPSDGARQQQEMLAARYESHTAGEAPKTMQHRVEAAIVEAMSYECEGSSEAVDDPGMEAPTQQPSVTQATTRRPRKNVSAEARLKKVSISCEWNMCCSVFPKAERLIAHVAEHLRAVTGPVSGDGYLCFWRECDFACSTKEELDRHVYFHAFHSKIKSIGLLLMEESDEKCILDSSGRNMIPEIPEVFQCMWEGCSVRFSSANDFYCHVLSHVLCTDSTGKSTKSFPCSWDGCTSTFAFRIRLRDHVRSHTQEKIVGCPNCGGIFASNTKFFDHCIRQMPLEAQQYQCSHCSRRYATERLLRDHVRHHINHYKCPECDMTVPNKSTLMAHVRYRHRKDKPHKCLQCGRGFKHLTDVTRHLVVHSAEPAYSCPFQNCDHKSRSLSTQNRHIRHVHNGLQKRHYVCHVCEAKFSVPQGLTKHLTKIHSYEWPVGHTRFRYKQEEDGFYRLQTVRYESIEQNQEILNEGEEEEEEGVDSPYASTLLSSPASHLGQLTPRDTPAHSNAKSEDENQMDPQWVLANRERDSKVVEHQQVLSAMQL